MKRIEALVFLFYLLLFIGCQPSEPEMPQTPPPKKSQVNAKKITPKPNKAMQLLTSAQDDVTRHLFESARKKINTIITQYPDTKEAVSARALLETIQSLSKKKKTSVTTGPGHQALPKHMRTKIDSNTGIAWYKDQNTPRYNDINSIYLYFGKPKNHPPFLRFRIRYCSDEWLHIMSFIVMADHERFLKSRAPFKRLTGTNCFQELYDEPVTPKLMRVIQKIIHSNQTTIRFHGQKGVGDILITQDQKQSMKNVLAAFRKMK